MKARKIRVLLFLFCMVMLVVKANAQSSIESSNRINEIKKWYAEIQAIGMKNCKSKTFIQYDGFDNASEKMPFEQKIQICQLNSVFSLKKGEFRGYESNRTICVYYRNNKIFFVFETGGAEGNIYESRYYCDANEKIVQELLSETESGQESKGPNKKMMNNLKKDIRTVINLNDFNH